MGYAILIPFLVLFASFVGTKKEFDGATEVVVWGLVVVPFILHVIFKIIM